MINSKKLGVMFNLKMEPRWNSEIGQVLQSNAKEEKKLKLQINRINSAKREQLGKIDQEMLSLRKQLLEDRKILGTRSDIKRRTDNNGNVLEGSNEAKQVSIVQPKLSGLQKSEAFDRNCFKTFQERSRLTTVEQRERKTSPPRLAFTEKEGNRNSPRRKVPEVGVLPPSCSTPSIRYGRRHSIAEINFSADKLLSKIYPQTISESVPMASVKFDHPRLRQRRASLPQAVMLDRDHSLDLPKLKTMKFQPERSKLALEKDSKLSNQDIKVGNFSRGVGGDVRTRRRRNSLPNFDSLPTNRDSMVCKERLTARLMQSKTKPGSAVTRNVTSPTKSSIFGRQFRKNPTPVSEKSDEANCEEQVENLSLDRMSLEEADDPGVDDEPLSCEQELSFIPKATLQEKMDKFFLEWVEGPEEEPRTDIEELLEEFRKEKEKKRHEQSNDAEKDLEIKNTAKDMSQCTGQDRLPVEEQN